MKAQADQLLIQQIIDSDQIDIDRIREMFYENYCTFYLIRKNVNISYGNSLFVQTIR